MQRYRDRRKRCVLAMEASKKYLLGYKPSRRFGKCHREKLYGVATPRYRLLSSSSIFHRRRSSSHPSFCYDVVRRSPRTTTYQKQYSNKSYITGFYYRTLQIFRVLILKVEIKDDLQAQEVHRRNDGSSRIIDGKDDFFFEVQG